MTESPSGERWISVTGTGEATVAPDLAVVSIGISGKGKELAATRDDVNRRTAAVLSALREIGIVEADLDAPSVGIHPEYDYQKGGQRLSGYLVSRGVTARVRDLGSLGAVLDGAVTAGANEMHGVRMTSTDPSAAERDALRAAVASARSKAEAIAVASGVDLGGATRIEEESDDGGMPMPRARMGAMMESADVATEVAAADLTVTRRIRAWFALD